MLIVPLSRDEVSRITIQRGRSAESLAKHLDARLPGLSDEFCKRYVSEVVQRLLTPILGFDPLTHDAFRDPVAFFGGERDPARLCERMAGHFSDKVDRYSPPSVVRAMIACIDYVLVSRSRGSVEAALAVVEATREKPGDLYDVRDPLPQEALIATEDRKAEILCSLIRELQAHTGVGI